MNSIRTLRILADAGRNFRNRSAGKHRCSASTSTPGLPRLGKPSWYSTS